MKYYLIVEVINHDLTNVNLIPTLGCPICPNDCRKSTLETAN